MLPACSSLKSLSNLATLALKRFDPSYMRPSRILQSGECSKSRPEDSPDS